jgi:hypothetical protein
VTYDYDRTRVSVERCHFHLGNGGITFTTFMIPDDSRKGTYGLECEVALSHFGTNTRFSFPLIGLGMVDWLLGSLKRTRQLIQNPRYYHFTEVSVPKPLGVIENGVRVPQPEVVCEGGSDQPTKCEIVYR